MSDHPIPTEENTMNVSVRDEGDVVGLSFAMALRRAANKNDALTEDLMSSIVDEAFEISEIIRNAANNGAPLLVPMHGALVPVNRTLN